VPRLRFTAKKYLKDVGHSYRSSGDIIQMPKLIFIKSDGSAHDFDVANGTTIMEAGRDANMGIEGTCGGSLSCATCHVVFDADDYVRVGPPSEDEMDMLDLAFNVTETSRLGCQIKMSDELDGLTAKVPEEF
jgi:2Fe-2S ferredoxin